MFCSQNKKRKSNRHDIDGIVPAESDVPEGTAATPVVDHQHTDAPEPVAVEAEVEQADEPTRLLPVAAVATIGKPGRQNPFDPDGDNMDAVEVIADGPNACIGAVVADGIGSHKMSAEASRAAVAAVAASFATAGEQQPRASFESAQRAVDACVGPDVTVGTTLIAAYATAPGSFTVSWIGNGSAWLISPIPGRASYKYKADRVQLMSPEMSWRNAEITRAISNAGIETPLLRSITIETETTAALLITSDGIYSEEPWVPWPGIDDRLYAERPWTLVQSLQAAEDILFELLAGNSLTQEEMNARLYAVLGELHNEGYLGDDAALGLVIA